MRHAFSCTQGGQGFEPICTMIVIFVTTSSHNLNAMRNLFILTLLFSAAIAFGQDATNPKFTKIISPGDIRSTPGLCDDAADYPLLVKELGSETAALICPYAEETKWPSALETLEKRNNGSRERMTEYNAWYVADLGSTVLLWISLKSNGHMPYDMRDRTDFFIMISRSAVSLGDKVMINTEAPEVQQSHAESPEKNTPSSGNSKTIGNYTKILNPGDLYSTPGLCEDEEDMSNLIKETGEFVAEKICIYAEESMWPSALETFEKREAGSRDKMKDYNTWYVADLGDDVVLLWVPMAENKHMPANMRDKTDFGVTIRKSSVALGEKKKLIIEGDESAPPAISINLAAKGFSDQLSNIVADYGNDFTTIKGDSIPGKKEGFLFNKEYTSLISLEGSEASLLSEEIFSGTLSFTARYGEYKDSIAARKKFDELVKKVDDAKISCCRWVKVDENTSEVLTTQAYIPFDLGGNMLPVYKDVMIEVSILKSFDLADWKMTDIWLVRVSVRKL
jgi:hypothetical protein